MKRKILFGTVIIAVAILLIQPTKNVGDAFGSSDILHAVSVPSNVLSIIQRSCYDCHSNHTVYPWYDHITPVNWWVKDHIEKGKSDLNFTEFGRYRKQRQLSMLKEIAETVQTDEMPLKSYLIMHEEVRLSSKEKQLILE